MNYWKYLLVLLCVSVFSVRVTSADVVLIGIDYDLSDPANPEALNGNGSFEDMDPRIAPTGHNVPRTATNTNASPAVIPGWTCTHLQGYVGWDGLGVGGQPAYDGERLAFVNNNSIADFLSDTIEYALLPATELELSMWACSNNDNTNFRLIVSFIFDSGLATESRVDLEEVEVHTETGNEYQLVMFTHKMTTGASTVAVNIRQDNDYNTVENDQTRVDAVQLIVIGDIKAASNPSPSVTDDVPRDVVLSWDSGEGADQHDVYFGMDYNDVNDADRTNDLDVLLIQGLTANSFDVGRLEFSRRYYWRIDEIDLPSNTITRGNIWTFEVEPISYALTGITATASDMTEDPMNTVNGSGLTDGLHGVDGEAMWKSSMTAQQPIWIQFAFERATKLHEMLIWNHNSDSEVILGYGFKDVTIETSMDGSTWSTLSEVQFNQAIGDEAYAANTTVDLLGVAAKYVRLTTKNNWSMLGLPNAGLSEVQFFYIPTQAREPEPANQSVVSPLNLSLSWRAGREVAAHEVLLSTEKATVEDGTALATTTTESSYTPSDVVLGQSYFWKINEVNEVETPAVWESAIWEFSTPDNLLIDDIESYVDLEGRWIWETWVDGYEDPANNGSTVGNGDLAETVIVHSGTKSMPIYFDNSTASTSVATRTFDQPDDITDWTQAGIQMLVLYVQGDPNNTGGQPYIEINGTKSPLTGDAGIMTREDWTQWNVDLTSVNADLTKVNTLGIGIDGADVKGIFYVDDIALYRIAPTPADPGGN